MNAKTRNRLILGVALGAVGAVVAYTMYFSLTPPRHADHDHAIARLNAGGFLWIEAADGSRRNLVGIPGKVLVLHWFDPLRADLGEQQAAAAFAERLASDPQVEVLFIAQAPSWDGVRAAARSAGIPDERLYHAGTAPAHHLCPSRTIRGSHTHTGNINREHVRSCAHQARGPVAWSGSSIGAQIDRAKQGVDEIH